MIDFLFPNFKQKALVLSFDDGVEDDVRLISLLDKYQLKGTFNLNSKYMMEEYSWVHNTGYKVTRLSVDKSLKTYHIPHEIASHSLSHPYMDKMSKEEIRYELETDKNNLEKIFKRDIYGYATPFYFYSDEIKEIAKDLGFSYLRTSFINEDIYQLNFDPYKVVSTIFHFGDVYKNKVNEFLKVENKLATLMIVGHSYDLTVHNMWEYFEDICKKFSLDKDLISLTTYEYISYLSAVKQVKEDEKEIINLSDQDIYLIYKDKKIILKRHESYLKN